MAVELKKRLISVVDYHKMAAAGILPERGIELINGEIIEMSPIGSKHAALVDRLSNLIPIQIVGKAIVRFQNPIIANDFSEPEPDISIVKYRPDFYEEDLPHGSDVLLAIEIGDTSVAYDRKYKLPLYAASGVAECWLVHLAKKEIQVYWQPSGSDYKFSELVKLGESIKAQHIDLELYTNQIFG